MSIPTVHYRTLEEMLAEIRTMSQEEKTFQSIRVSAHSRVRVFPSHSEKSVQQIVVTSLMVDRYRYVQYGLWVWSVSASLHKRGVEFTPWTKPEMDTLISHLLRSINYVIERETGIVPKTGMYSVDTAWFDTSGTTQLIDLSLYLGLIKPPAGIQVRPITTGQTLVLGSIEDGLFQEAPDSLTSDDRIRIVTPPDLTSTWLCLPVGYERAIATKEGEDEASYTVLYTPAQGETRT